MTTDKKQYFAIVQDVQTYEVRIELPASLTQEERDEAIMEHLSEHRDQCWTAGEESIVAVDEVTSGSSNG